jgi:hypothetical protein
MPVGAAQTTRGRERRLEDLRSPCSLRSVKRDGAVEDADQRAGEVLLTMTDDECLSMREAADWCGSGVTVREVTRLRQLAHDRKVPPANESAPRVQGSRSGRAVPAVERRSAAT